MIPEKRHVPPDDKTHALVNKLVLHSNYHSAFKVEEETDKRGYVVRKVIRRPVYVTTRRTVIRRMKTMPDGKEKELEKSIEESGEIEDSEPPVTKRIVKRTIRDKSGKEKVVEEPEYLSPLEVSTTEESEPEIEEKRQRGTMIRTVRRRSLVTTQRRVVRRVVERPDGRQEGPVEDEMEEPIEEPEDIVPEESTPEVQEMKDRKGVVIRRVVRRPVPVKTARKVYRTIVLAPDGKEESVEEKVEEPGQPQEEVVVPMEYAETEALPDEPTTRRQIFRTPVPKEDVPQEPTPEETVTLEDGRIIRRTVTVRKRTIRKIIILPDGTRKEVEEEVPEEAPEQAPEDVKEVIQTRTVRRQEPEEVTRRQVYRTVTTTEVPAEPEKKEPRMVERMFVRRLIRKPDGTETLVDESETITPLEAIPTEQESEQVIATKLYASS